jgi:hypothetical protein
MQVKDRERSNGTVQPADMQHDWILENTRLGVILQLTTMTGRGPAS